jgi:hypothetical protein
MRHELLGYFVTRGEPNCAVKPMTAADRRRSVQVYLVCLTFTVASIVFVPRFFGSFILYVTPMMIGFGELKTAYGRRGAVIAVAGLLAATFLTLTIVGPQRSKLRSVKREQVRALQGASRPTKLLPPGPEAA